MTVSKGLNAECIVLLIGVVRTYGLEESFSIDVLSLAEKFFSTKNTVIKLFQSLRQSGYVLTEEAFNSRGRGKNIYTFTQAFRDELKNDSFIKHACESDNPAIDILFKNKAVIKKEDGVDNKILLRSSNRLFILIFILHADEFGVISNLSTSDISKLMGGISKDRFKSQLKTLYDIGVMKCHVSGVTGKELFGKIKGRYYLDLSNPIFNKCYGSVSQLRVRFNGIAHGNTYTEAGALFKGYRNFNEIKDFVWPSVVARYLESFDFKGVIHFFNTQTIQEQFQLLLFDIASEILSNCWHEPEKFTHSPDVLNLLSPPVLMNSKKASELDKLEGLKDRIDNIFSHGFGEDISLSEYHSNKVAKSYFELVFLIRRLSLAIANRYKLFLIAALGKEFELDKLMITPITAFKMFENKEYIELFGMRYIGGHHSKMIELQILENRLEISKNGKAFELHGQTTSKDNISKFVDKILLPRW